MALTTILLSPAFGVGQVAEWRFDPNPVVEIGGSFGDPNDQLGSVRDVARFETGEIVVLDALGPAIRVYRGDGLFLRTIGRPGDGPGEFRQPTHIVIRADTIVVLDQAGRRTWMSKDGELLRTEPADLGGLCTQEYNLAYGGLLSDGSLLIRCEERIFGQADGEYRQEVGLLIAGFPEAVDTLGWFPADTGRTDARGVPVPRPYSPQGQLLAEALAPIGAEILAVGNEWILALWRSPLDVDQLRLYRFSRMWESGTVRGAT